MHASGVRDEYERPDKMTRDGFTAKNCQIRELERGMRERGKENVVEFMNG